MIGNVEIPNRTVLAPMAGVTNSAFVPSQKSSELDSL